MTEILLALPDSAERTRISQRLTAAGFVCVTALTGTDTLSLLGAPRFSAVLLDWQYPDMTGLDVLHEMRTRSLDTPVMMLSHRTSVAERIQALDGGADDYLIRPYHIDECLARIRRLVRVYALPAASGSAAMCCIADLTVDFKHHVVTRGGKRLLLSARECAILECLAQRPGVTLSGSQIEASLNKTPEQSASATIPVYIHWLRRKIDDGFSRPLLHTVRSRGYMLKA